MASIRRSLIGFSLAAPSVLFACTFQVEDRGSAPIPPSEPAPPAEPASTSSCRIGEGRLTELGTIATTLTDAHAVVSAAGAGPRGAFAVGTRGGSVGVFGFDDDGPRLDSVIYEVGESASYGPATGCPLAYSADGRRLALASSKGAVAVWDSDARAVVARLPASGGAVRTLAVSADGSLVAVGDLGSRVRIWSPDSGEPEPVSQEFSADALAFVPETNDLLVAGRTLNGWSSVQQLERWSAASGFSQTGFCGTEPIRSLASTPDGMGMIAVSTEVVKRFDTGNLAIGAIQGSAVSHDPLAVTVSNDGRLFATIGREGTLRLFNTSTLAELARADVALQVGVTIDPDRKRVVTVGRDGTLHVFGCTR